MAVNAPLKYLQSFNNAIYYFRFNKRLVPLNIDDYIIFLPKLLKRFIAAFRACKLHNECKEF